MRHGLLALIALILIGLAGVNPTVGQAVETPKTERIDGTRVYLAKEATDGVPEPDEASSFDCSDRIYAVLESKTLEQGRHDFLVTWVGPAGKERERVEYEFFAREQTRIWSWLKLHRGAGGTLLSVFDSAAGLEEMIGQWTVKFVVDGHVIKQADFDVLC